MIIDTQVYSFYALSCNMIPWVTYVEITFQEWSMEHERWVNFPKIIVVFYHEKGQNWLSWEPFNCSSYVKTISLLTAPAEEPGNLFGHNMQLFLNYPIINTPTANWKGGTLMLRISISSLPNNMLNLTKIAN